MKEYFEKNPPRGMEYDIGGYVEPVELDLAYDPHKSELIDSDNET